MFSLNSLFGRKMTKLLDLCLLNMLCILTSIPMVTAGVSMTALYTVLMAMTKDEEAPVLKMYFRAFRANFRNSLIAGVLMVAVTAVLILDIEIWTGSASQLKPMYLMATFVLLVFAAMVGCWLSLKTA